MKSTPSQGQDLLEGVYQTPLDLLRPIHKRFPLIFDVAANAGNCVTARLGFGAEEFYDESDNALVMPWTKYNQDGSVGFVWCNPPFDDIGAWTAKAESEFIRGAKIVMLLPSATGAKWLEPCIRSAQIVFLKGRPVFEFINPMTHKNPDKRGKPNTDCYGKDLLLAVFGQGTGVSWWNWRTA